MHMIEDFLSFDINFQRICFMVAIGFFLLAIVIFAFWSAFVYLPLQQGTQESRRINEFVKEFYERKGLPLPADLNLE